MLNRHFVGVDKVVVTVVVVKKKKIIIRMSPPKSTTESQRRMERSRPPVWPLPLGYTVITVVRLSSTEDGLPKLFDRHFSLYKVVGFVTIPPELLA